MKALVALALGGAVTWGASAAGLTGEEWALVWRQLGEKHLALSGDGQWMLRVQGQKLLREATLPSGPATQAQDLTSEARALAVSRDGRRAVVLTAEHCIAVVDFGAGGPPRLGWLAAPLLSEKTDAPAACPRPGAVASQLSFALALSADGRRLAVQVGAELRLIDIDAGRVLRRWPLGRSEALQLAFVNDDRQVLVRAALLGERWESAADISGITLALWDAQDGGLVDLSWEQRSFIDDAALLAALSPTGGLLWQLEAAQGRDPRDRALKVVGLSTAECGWPRRARFRLQMPPRTALTRGLELAADPAGRWVAINDYEPGEYAAVWLWATADGRRLGGELRRGPAQQAWRALVASADGARLWGLTGGQPKGNVDPELRTPFEGGGQLVGRPVESGLVRPAEPAARRTGRCAIAAEGESDPAVREVKDAVKPAQLLFEQELASLGQAQAARSERCQSENGRGSYLPARWGIHRDGELWVDDGHRLRCVDPVDGRMLAEMPTPRSEQVCSVAVFSARQFLNWQGDTVTLRPFEAAQGAASRRIVARRPGWVADGAAWVDKGRIAVRWLDPKAKPEVSGGAQGQVYVEAGGRFVPEGAPAPGQATSSGHVFIDGEDGEGGEGHWSPPDGDWPVSPQPARHRWRSGPFGSVQAHNEATHALALWDGMKAGAPGDAHGATALGGELGYAWVGDRLVVYDAARRERRLVLPAGVSRIAHLPAPGVLLVEADNRLRAYRLPP